MQAIAAHLPAGECNILNNKLAFVSIVVPTLNEVSNVCGLARSLHEFPEAEIIFADGGSCDGTQHAIESHCNGDGKIRLVHAPCSRARQMNEGAKVARGHGSFFYTPILFCLRSRCKIFSVRRSSYFCKAQGV